MKKNKIVFVGGHNLGCACLDHIVLKGYKVALVVARADDSGEDGVFPSLLKRAQELGLPVVKGATANAPEVLEAIRRADPDIGLSIVNNMILGGGWFDLLEPRLGIVNIHYAPLPRYAGYWPEMWAIWNGETEFGVTLHYAAPKVDAGDIIAQRSVSIAPDETRVSLYRKNDAAALELIKENLDRLLTARVNGIPQDESQRTYCKRELPNGGFIDLAWSAEKIDRFIRAVSFPPFTGPKIKIGGAVHTLLAEDIPFFRPVYVSHIKPASNASK